MGTFSIDIGKVVGENGQDGQTGPQGPQGPSGSETTVTNAALAHTTGTKSMKVVLTLQDNSTVESGEVAVPGNFGAFSRAPTDGDKANYDQFLDLSNGKLWKLDAETDEWVEGAQFMRNAVQTAQAAAASGYTMDVGTLYKIGNIVITNLFVRKVTGMMPGDEIVIAQLPSGFRPIEQSRGPIGFNGSYDGPTAKYFDITTSGQVLVNNPGASISLINAVFVTN